MSTITYYFTGTGNSLKVAKDLTRYLGDAKLVSIRQERLTEELFTEAKVIGFVVPTYFRGIPKLVGQFIDHLEIRNKSPYIFAVSTYGEGNGIGIVSQQIEKHLAQKGLALSAYFPVQMPNNGPTKEHVTTAEEKALLFSEANKMIPVIGEKIREFQVTSTKHNRFRNIIDQFINNRMYLSTRKPLDKGFHVDDKCTGCSTCSKVCPANNIQMVDGKPKWKLQNCQYCMACLQWCPNLAIQYNKETIGVERYHHPEIKVGELFQ